MRVAITGGTGFIGSYVSRSFIDSGHDVYLLVKDLPSNIDSRFNLVIGDVSIFKDVDYFVKKSSPDIIIHLAAQTQAHYSFEYPYDTFNTNVVGTMNILESARLYGKAKAILIASSDKSYGELAESEYTEDSQLNGIYPYDTSKSITDMLSRSYSLTYGMPIATVRSCNVYGFGDSNTLRIIPGIIDCYKNNKEFVIRNLGQDEREYIHVYDVVSAYKHIVDYISNSGSFESFNLSSGDRYTTSQVFDIVNSYLGNSVKYRLHHEDGPELKVQRVSSVKLRMLTGWSPKHLLVDSIKEIIEKYLSK